MELKNALVAAAVALALFVLTWLFVSVLPYQEAEEIAAVVNFEECVAAGYPVMPARQSLGDGGESYPRQCNTPEGGHFVEEIGKSLEDDIFSFDVNGCKRAGCSSELCVPESYGDVGTICVYRPEYACYAWSKCERQRDGTCGWTQTPAFQQCLANPPPMGGELQVM